MVRAQTFLLGASLLAVVLVAGLMVAGVEPAQRSSVLGALILGETIGDSSLPEPAVTPIDEPISFDGLQPGQTDAFGLRAGLVVVQVLYDGAIEPFSASLRSLDDPQAEPIAPITLIPPLDRRGGATGQVVMNGRYVLHIERADGEWAVTIAQPAGSG